MLCTHGSQIFQYKLKRKKKPCIVYLSMKEGSLFVLYGLAPWHLDLWLCRSSWILNDFFTEN
jgi:hypothetical protein